MINRLLGRDEKVVSTDFSNFFNNAKSAERKKVFEQVLTGACRRQEKVLAERSRSINA
ncbi:hypothetical protein [Denitrificimonas caeni]|uniref:hypothetical protein n=1 Tax=Denitrificimonas caeni TaxID=521720 RepID=UPI0003B57D48|nr:hypothetical protein [Denitrificimonas caeni]